MAMKRCPDCGEKYSDTYRRCPFCEEEEAVRSGSAPRRRGGYRASQRSGGGALSTVLILAIVVMACVLGWLLFGDKLGKSDPAGSTPSSSVSEPNGSNPSGSGDISMPEEPDDPSGTGETPVVVADPSTLPQTLTLNKTDYTTNTADAPVQLKVTGSGSGYTWSSADESIAMVDENGKVTALSAGMTYVYATDGTGMGVCIVRVKGATVTPVTPTQPGTGTTPSGSGGEQKLNREDFTLPVGSTFQLQLGGVTTELTWKSKNSAVATVSSNGTVTAVANGTTTITVSWDGQERSCIVRVK